MSKIYIPTTGPSDWRALLADPQKHWARGYSARTLANCWEAADGFLPEVLEVLTKVSSLAGIRPLLILPEWKVKLPGGATQSQNDVWVLAKCDAGLVSIAVEGKVEESFDNRLRVWKKSASTGKLEERLPFLTCTLRLPAPIPDDIYYHCCTAPHPPSSKLSGFKQHRQ